MARQAVVNQREITETGVIQVRIAKQVIDAGEVVASSWHRCAFTPGCDVDGTIAAVDTDLTNQGYGPVQDWSGVRSLVALEHTPEVIEAYQAAQAAAAKD